MWVSFDFGGATADGVAPSNNTHLTFERLPVIHRGRDPDQRYCRIRRRDIDAYAYTTSTSQVPEECRWFARQYESWRDGQGFEVGNGDGGDVPVFGMRVDHHRLTQSGATCAVSCHQGP